MGAILVTGALRDQLKTCRGEVELRDEAGDLIGRFSPSNREIPELDLTDEEVARRLSPNAKTHTTAEVLAYCKELAK